MIYVLYHRDNDGAFAAAAAYHVFKDTATYISVQYGEEFPIKELTSTDEVYIVDFSYKKDLLDKVHKTVKKLVVLDHHKTAQEELLGTPYSIFDMYKCGCTLAWEYFRPDEEMPEIYKLVEDRDLFKNSMTYTEHVAEALYMYDLNNIPEIYDSIQDPSFLSRLIDVGNVLISYKVNHIEKTISKQANRVGIVNFEGHETAIYNAIGYIWDMAKPIRDEYDVSVTMSYMMLSDACVFNMRSIGDIDVSEIALKYGGGGHKNAACFRLPYSKAFELITNLVTSQ